MQHLKLEFNQTPTDKSQPHYSTFASELWQLFARTTFTCDLSPIAPNAWENSKVGETHNYLHDLPEKFVSVRISRRVHYVLGHLDTFAGAFCPDGKTPNVQTVRMVSRSTCYSVYSEVLFVREEPPSVCLWSVLFNYMPSR